MPVRRCDASGAAAAALLHVLPPTLPPTSWRNFFFACFAPNALAIAHAGARLSHSFTSFDDPAGQAAPGGKEGAAAVPATLDSAPTSVARGDAPWAGPEIVKESLSGGGGARAVVLTGVAATEVLLGGEKEAAQ